MNFKEICKETQKTLKTALESELSSLGYKNIENADGYLYAAGEIPVLLLAHMDTVHKETCTIICESDDGDVVMSPQGIGGDDRCGIYMVISIIKELKCHVLFTEDEEIGCIGAGKFTKSEIKPDVNYCIQFDRKNGNDSVYYFCDNKEFEDFINAKGFVTAHGSCSDISKVAPYLGVAAVNLSCGYYSPHTCHEYVIMSEMENNIKRAKEIIATPSEKFEYIEKKITYSSNYYSSYPSYSSSKWDYDWYSDNYSKSSGSKVATNSLYDDYDESESFWNQVYDDPEYYTIHAYENHIENDIAEKELIPVPYLVGFDYDDTYEFKVNLDDEEYSIDDFLQLVTSGNDYSEYDLYIDKYCNLYVDYEEQIYGAKIAVETDAFLVCNKKIEYPVCCVAKKYVMDKATFEGFEEYISLGLFDDDMEIENSIYSGYSGI